MNDRVPAEVFPPGEFIREELKERGWCQADLAQILDRPLQMVNQVMSGKKAITANTARELAAVFGTSAQFWMDLESAWQLHRQDKASDVTRVRSRARLYDVAPIREMQKRGWLKKTKTSQQLEGELRRFFDVRNLNDVPNLAAAARASTQGKLAGMTPAQWAWCRRACQVAQMVDAKKFVPSKLSQLVHALRPLMSEPEEIRHVPKVLATAGIRLVVVEHLSGTRIDGAALWPLPTTPVVAMSMRYGRIDYFWFTLLHELTHILHQHGERADVDISERSENLDKVEEMANNQAEKWLIPSEKLESFILRTTPLYSTQRIRNFAKRMSVHPSIVIGQLKFRGELDWGQFSRLQQQNIRPILQQAAMCDGWGRVAPMLA